MSRGYLGGVSGSASRKYYTLKRGSSLGFDSSESLKDQIYLEPPMFVKLVQRKLNLPDNSIFDLTLITYWI